jgi:hypothetical protein
MFTSDRQKSGTKGSMYYSVYSILTAVYAVYTAHYCVYSVVPCGIIRVGMYAYVHMCTRI